MKDTIFYYTGLFVWFMFGAFCGWMIWFSCYYLYKRYIKQTIGNLRFILFGSKKISSYYDQWLKYSKPGIRKFWSTKKYLRRYAYRSLVRRAWRERKKYRMVLKVAQSTIGFDIPGTPFEDIGPKINQLISQMTNGKAHTNGANGLTEGLTINVNEENS